MNSLKKYDGSINKNLVNQYLEQNDLPKYIFGTNKYGLLVAKYLTQNVIFINELSSDEMYEGYSLIHDLNEVKEGAIVLNCIMSSYPITIRKKLDLAGIQNIDLFSLIKFGNIPIQIDYWEGFEKSYCGHKDEYDKLYDHLGDGKSKDTYRRLMDLRINLNLESMSVFTVNEENQYFESFLGLKSVGETFVDVGGYDGSTTLRFISRCPEYKKIYFLEPAPSIMEKAKNKLRGRRDIEYCQIAASDKKQTMHFNLNESASSVSEDGELEIKADTIDSMINTPVTFIKMDVEGSESMAIDGARETILRDHPRLAICVYHKGGDYVDIPRQVLSIRKDYIVYLRHYTEGVTETVMFFIPA